MCVCVCVCVCVCARACVYVCIHEISKHTSTLSRSDEFLFHVFFYLISFS